MAGRGPSRMYDGLGGPPLFSFFKSLHTKWHSVRISRLHPRARWSFSLPRPTSSIQRAIFSTGAFLLRAGAFSSQRYPKVGSLGRCTLTPPTLICRVFRAQRRGHVLDHDGHVSARIYRVIPKACAIISHQDLDQAWCVLAACTLIRQSRPHCTIFNAPIFNRLFSDSAQNISRAM